jgi:hypothetical protein
MSGRKKSESLFGDSSQPPPAKQQGARRRPDFSKEQRTQSKKEIGALRKDYLFRGELKDKFEEEVKKAGGDPRNSENTGVIKQINRMQSHVVKKENALMKAANERRKRHYALNGDVRVYCYVKNQWPKMIVRPLSIRIDKFPEVPPLGPFEGENEFLLEAVFRPITLGVRRALDPFIYEPVSDTSDQLTVNTDEYKKLAFLTCFKSWNIPCELPFNENGFLSEEAREVIERKLHPLLFDVLSGEFIALNNISEQEYKMLDQQCDRLFGKGDRGVSNPLEGIKLYCEASALAKEFHLSGKDLDELPLRVSSLIRHVSQKGNEIQSKELEASRKGKSKPTKVVGRR